MLPMSEPRPEDHQPTLSGNPADQTPLPEPSGSFYQHPTLGGSAAAPPGDAPTIPGYEVIEEIGRGGMGVVYKARQHHPRRLVALKVLRAGADGPTDRARFEREANALARLSCPGVVQVYDAGCYLDRDGASRPYVALELVRGVGLDRVLRGGVLRPRQAAALLLQLARTMQAVHASGIVHRDLKPANVLLQASRGRQPPEGAAPADVLPTPGADAPGSPDYAPKITDFGLAHLLDADDAALTRAGQVLGTPSYAAPEQVESARGPIGPACDVHSLGAILYECLTGRPPFKGATLAETLDQVARLEPVAVRRLRPDVPRDLETICHKCLRKDPDKRYKSADALADDLDRFLAGRTIAARPVSSVEAAWRGVRRRPITSALAALLAVFVVAGAFLAAWLPAHLQSLRRDRDAAAAQAEKNRAVALSHQYHSLMQAAAGPPDGGPEWHARTLQKIRAAAALDTPLRDPADLRSHAARCLGATDFAVLPGARLGFTACRIAAHPSQPLLAVAQFKAWPWMRCRVALLETPSGKVAREVYFVPTGVLRTKDRVAAQDGVSALAFSPDGRWLVAGTRAGSLVRWDLDHAEPAATIWPAHKGAVRHVCLDDDVLFSSGEDGQLVRWSLCADWAETHRGADAGQPALASGELVVAGGDRVHFLDPSTLSPRRQPVANKASLLSVPPGPAPMILAHGPWLWLADAGRKQTEFRRNRLPAHDAAVSDLATSPDGDLVASACDKEGRVRVWDAASMELLAELPRVGDFCRVAFDASGRWLAVLDATEVRYFEVRRSQVQTRAALTARPVLAACWAGRGRLACVSGDRHSHEGEASVWPAGGPPLVRKAIRLPEVRLPVRLAAGRGRLAWVDEGGVSLSRPEDLYEQARVKAKDVWGLADDGERLWLAAEGKARLWRGPEARPGPCWDNGFAEKVTGVASLWCVAAGRRVVVVGGKDGGVRVLGAEKADVLASKHLSAAPVCGVALSADESCALAGMGDGAVMVLRLDGMEAAEVGPRHRDRVTAAAFLPGGRAVTASADGDVRLWEMRCGTLKPYLTLSLGAPVVGASVSEDGERLAVVLAGERAVRVWRLDRLRQELAEMGLE
jgi:serine/threonine protein kinase/WD40 repeat protein